MGLTTDEAAARDRLIGTYNGNAYHATQNPGGFRNDGYEINFFPCVTDVATVGTAVGRMADAAAASAAAAAAGGSGAGSLVSQYTIFGRADPGTGAKADVAAPMLGVVTAADAAAARGVLGVLSAADVAADLAPLQNNILLLWLELQIATAVAGGAMADGWHDAFLSDTLGVISANEHYDAAGDWYGNLGAVAQVSQGTGTTFGTMTAAGGNAAAFDGTTVQAAAAGARNIGGSNYAAYVGKFYAGTRVVTGFKAWGPSDDSILGNGATTSIKLQVSADTTDGSDGTWTDIYTGTASAGAGVTIDQSAGAVPTAARAARVAVQGNGVNAINLAEVQIFERPLTALTLQPAAASAEAQPDTVRLLILAAAGGVLNTDLIAEASRDGGTTWTTVPLVDEGAYDGTWTTYAGTADISAQPAGTNMLWRLRTTAAVVQRVRGVAMMWG